MVSNRKITKKSIAAPLCPLFYLITGRDCAAQINRGHHIIACLSVSGISAVSEGVLAGAGVCPVGKVTGRCYASHTAPARFRVYLSINLSLSIIEEGGVCRCLTMQNYNVSDIRNTP